MASSERLFSGERYRFSQKCSLLSQYLKEGGTFGDLTLGLNPSSGKEIKGTDAAGEDFLNSNLDLVSEFFDDRFFGTETMDLLPKVEKSRRTATGGIR